MSLATTRSITLFLPCLTAVSNSTLLARDVPTELARSAKVGTVLFASPFAGNAVPVSLLAPHLKQASNISRISASQVLHFHITILPLIDSRKRSGSRVGLLRPGPLRTGLESFPSSGSSLD